MDNQKLISIGELFKKSFAFYKENMYHIVMLALIPFIGGVLSGLLFAGVDSDKITIFRLGAGLLALLLVLAFAVAAFVVRMAYFYLIREKDTMPSTKNLLSISFKNITSPAWILFLVGIICVAGFILLIVPGIILSVWFSLSLYVFIFEGTRGMKALYRSKELVKGYWWPVFGRFLLFGLCAAIIGSIPVLGGIINVFFIMPLGIIYGYFLYENLKALKK